MRPLLAIYVMLFLLVGAGPLCAAGTTDDYRQVFIYKPLPRYPMEAWERRSDGLRRVEGETVVRVSIDANGAVSRVLVFKTSGNKYLDAASTAALRNWRAKPGRPGRVFDIPINFTISRSSPGSALSYDWLGPAKTSDVGKGR